MRHKLVMHSALQLLKKNSLNDTLAQQPQHVMA